MPASTVVADHLLEDRRGTCRAVTTTTVETPFQEVHAVRFWGEGGGAWSVRIWSPGGRDRKSRKNGAQWPFGTLGKHYALLYAFCRGDSGAADLRKKNRQHVVSPHQHRARAGPESPRGELAAGPAAAAVPLGLLPPAKFHKQL